MAAPRAHCREIIVYQRSDGTLAPVPSPTVHVYNQGTTTAISQTIYSTATGSGTLTNPITGGTDGSVEFWLPIEQTVDLGISATGYGNQTVTSEVVVALGSGIINLNSTTALTNTGDVYVNGEALTYKGASSHTAGALDQAQTWTGVQTLELPVIGDSSDNSKALKFALSGATTGTATTLTASQTADRTITLPNSTTTLAGLGVAQTFTAAQTFTGGLTASAGTVSLTSPTMTTATVSSGGLTVTAGGLKVTAGGIGVGITPVGGQPIVLHTATDHNLSVTDSTNGPLIQAQNDANSASVAVLIGNGSNVIATFTPSGGLQMGAPTGGDKGAGTLNVASGVYLNGTAYTNPDFVFEHHYTGQIRVHKNKRMASGYRGLPTLLDMDATLNRTHRLPYMDGGFGVNGETHDIFSGGEALLLHVEQAFLYLIDHEKRLQAKGI